MTKTCQIKSGHKIVQICRHEMTVGLFKGQKTQHFHCPWEAYRIAHSLIDELTL